MPDIESLVSTKEAATMKGLKPQAFMQWVYRGIAPKAIKVGRDNYFDRSQIEGWEKPADRRKYNGRKNP